MTIDKNTIVGIFVAAVITALGAELVRTYAPGFWAWVAVQRKQRVVYVKYPPWYTGSPARMFIGILPVGDNPEDIDLQAFSGKYTMVRRKDIPAGDVEIFVRYDDGNRTYVLFSQSSFPPEVKKIEYSIPDPDGEGSAWRTFFLNKLESSDDGALAPETVAQRRHPWLQLALGEVGVVETRDRLNPRIREYWEATSFPTNRLSANLPWGCAFVSWVIEIARQPGNIRSARCADWIRYGQAVSGPAKGALAVFTPFIREASSGFVGFITDFDDTTVTVVGGNLDDSVAIKRYPRNQVRGYRWPGTPTTESHDCVCPENVE